MFAAFAEPQPYIPIEDCRRLPIQVLSSAGTHPGMQLHDCRAVWEPTRHRGAIQPGRLRPHPALRWLPLNDEHWVAYVPSVSRIVVLDRAARRLLLALDERSQSLDAQTVAMLQALYDHGLITDSAGVLPILPEPDTLVAWLHVTSECNLRCSYCYTRKSPDRMDEAMGHAMVDAIVRSAKANGFKGVFIKFAGGEPLLNLPLIERLQRYARQTLAHHGLALQAGVLSNGISLEPSHVALLRDLGLRLMISLDGLGDSHDAQRPTAGGRPSAWRTVRSIELALAEGLVPDISVTVTGRSVGGLPTLTRWLLEHELPFSLSFYRESRFSESARELHLDEEHLIAGMRAAYAEIEQRPPRWGLLHTLLDRVDLSTPHSHACAAGHSLLVFDPNGRVAKCQMGLQHTVALATDPDPLALVRADHAGLRNIPVDEREDCRDCEWRHWCAGGCPDAAFHASGHYEARSPNCAIYKALLPDIIRLEGLRILHWHARH